MKVNWDEWKENIVGDSFFYFNINDGRRVVAVISEVQEGDEVFQIVTVDDLEGNEVYRGRPEAFETWFEDATSGVRCFAFYSDMWYFLAGAVRVYYHGEGWADIICTASEAEHVLDTATYDGKRVDTVQLELTGPDGCSVYPDYGIGDRAVPMCSHCSHPHEERCRPEPADFFATWWETDTRRLHTGYICSRHLGEVVADGGTVYRRHVIVGNGKESK